MSQPAKKEVAQEGKPATSKGKGRSSRGAPKGGGESSAKTGKEEAGMQSGGESKEWRPSSREQEVPPDLPGDPGPGNKVMQARTQPEAHEHECK
jgi:hypothetical protein